MTTMVHETQTTNRPNVFNIIYTTTHVGGLTINGGQTALSIKYGPASSSNTGQQNTYVTYGEMSISKPNVVDSVGNHCQLKVIYTEPTSNIHSVSADGTNTLNLDLKTLVVENGNGATLCGETPTISLTSANEISNNRGNILRKIGDNIQWVNTAGDYKPPVSAKAEAHYGITLRIATSTDFIQISIADYTVSVTHTAACLATASSLISTTSLTVSADGSNTVNLDPTVLSDINTELLSACATDTPTVTASIS